MGSWPQSPVTRIAFFITAHGFGHAARAAAVMMAVQARNPTIHFEIFTAVPRWFFEQSLAGPFSYHQFNTDVGLVQQGTFVQDLPATIARLDELVPFRADRVEYLAGVVRAARCALVMCDIAPLGIAVARAAGIPSVLVENFTWDWIYAGYTGIEPRLEQYASYLADVFHSADFHIQTNPVCLPWGADLTTPPVSRPLRVPMLETRHRLGIPDQMQVVLISMGGIPGDYGFVPLLKTRPGILFILPGMSSAWNRADNVLLLPHDNGLYHPDLIAAADLVIAKLGYSTVAEVYHAGLPLGFVGRAGFAESEIVKRFVVREIPSLEIQQADFQNGTWLDRLPRLLQLPRVERNEPNGADLIADFVLNRFHN